MIQWWSTKTSTMKRKIVFFIGIPISAYAGMMVLNYIYIAIDENTVPVTLTFVADLIFNKWSMLICFLISFGYNIDHWLCEMAFKSLFLSCNALLSSYFNCCP